MKQSLLAMWTVAVLATAAAFVTYLAVRFENVRLGYALDEGTREQKRLSEVLRMLSLEAQTLREHQRVQTIAQRALGMVPADRGSIIAVDAAARRSAAGRAR
jgi:cell division protein FtsL